jgi:spermidine synthase
MYFFILILFFLSGFSSLIYQIIWLKKLHLIFGVTTPSIVATLIAFMSGLSFGSFIFGKYSSKFKKPFLTYGIMEGVIGIYAFFINYFFQIADKVFIFSYNHLSNSPFFSDFFRFLISFIILFLPTFLMGGTFPLIIQGVEKLNSTFGKKTGTLYGINTLGAFFGVFSTTFFLIPKFGFKTTNYFAILINFFIFFSSFFILKEISLKTETEKFYETKYKKYFLMIIFFMGFTSFGYEVLWNRVLILHTGSNVYAYGLVLCNILIGIGVGSFVYSIFHKKIKDPLKTLGWVELLLAFYSLFQIYLFLNFTDILIAFASLPWKSAISQVFYSLFFGTSTLLFIPTFLMGLSFPLTIKIFAKEKENPGNVAGKVYGINTFGCIAGTFFTGIFLIPKIGTTKTFFLMIFINLLLSFLILENKKEKLIPFILFFPLIGLFFIFPSEKIFLSAGIYKEEKNKVFAFKEDITGAVIGIEKKDGLSLEINGINVAGTSPDLFLIQKLQGHIPLLFSKNPKNVLHIGLGSGGTLYTVSKYGAETIYVAEISPAIIDISSKYFTFVNHNVFQDKRIKIKIADGRNFVLASKEKFNVILSDSIHPKYLGNGFLYTKDYFKLIFDKMDSDGIASMWLPLYSLTPKNYKEILKAFSDTFPYVFVWWFPKPMNSFTIVIGSKSPFDFKNFIEKMDEEKIRDDLNTIKYYEKEKILSCIILDEKKIKDYTKGIKPHIDDLPTVEYESNKVFTKTKTWLFNIKTLYQATKDFSVDFKMLPIDQEKYKNNRKIIIEEMEKQIEILQNSEPF